jgi:hypothetical protein
MRRSGGTELSKLVWHGPQVHAKARQAARITVIRAGWAMVDYARPRMPVKTGRTRDTTQVQELPSWPVVGNFGPRTTYAIYVRRVRDLVRSSPAAVVARVPGLWKQALKEVGL